MNLRKLSHIWANRRNQRYTFREQPTFWLEHFIAAVSISSDQSITEETALWRTINKSVTFYDVHRFYPPPSLLTPLETYREGLVLLEKPSKIVISK